MCVHKKPWFECARPFRPFSASFPPPSLRQVYAAKSTVQTCSSDFKDHHSINSTQPPGAIASLIASQCHLPALLTVLINVLINVPITVLLNVLLTVLFTALLTALLIGPLAVPLKPLQFAKTKTRAAYCCHRQQCRSKLFNL